MEMISSEDDKPTNSLMKARLETHYDPHEFGDPERPTTFWNAMTHLLAIYAGPTILSIPISFARTGYGVGIFSALFCTFLYAHCIDSLVRSESQVCESKRVPNLSYPDLIYAAFLGGPPTLRWFAHCGRHIINIVFIVFWTSACCYSSILVSESVQIVYNQWMQTSVNVHTVMSWVVVPVMLLCWVPSLKYLVPVFVLCGVANAVCICMIIYDMVSSRGPFDGLPPVGSMTQVPFAMNTVLFVINATGLMLPLKKEMRKPARFNHPLGVITVSYVSVFFMYATFGLLCAFKYGSNTKESIAQNTSPGDPITHWVMLANAIALTLQYPLQVYIIFDVIWNNFLDEGELVNVNRTVQEYSIRTAIIAVIFLVTYIVPYIELFITIGGVFGTVIDSLFFPACVQIVVMWRVRDTRKGFGLCLCKNVAIIALAAALIVSGGVACVQNILQKYGN